MIVDEFTTLSVTHIATIAPLRKQCRSHGINDTHRGVIERRLGYKTVNVSRKRQSRLKRLLGGLNAILLNMW